jgi:hypothetical protein
MLEKIKNKDLVLGCHPERKITSYGAGNYLSETGQPRADKIYE